MSEDRAEIRVRLNGETRQVRAGLTILDLLRELELRPELIVVERNGEILQRSSYSDTTLTEGDTLELVHFVGGG